MGRLISKSKQSCSFVLSNIINCISCQAVALLKMVAIFSKLFPGTCNLNEVCPFQRTVVRACPNAHNLFSPAQIKASACHSSSTLKLYNWLAYLF